MTQAPGSVYMLGLYLVPPPSVLVPLSFAHAVLEREFGAIVAGRFMVHATVKGFFEPKPGTDVDALAHELDGAYEGMTSFPVALGELELLDSDKGTSAVVDLELSESLARLEQATWRTMEPYIAPDCPFTSVEQHGSAYRPHLTLAQNDLPSDPGLLEQAFGLCRYLCNGLPRRWEALDLQLVRFDSADWYGAWWETLRYRQLKGWRLLQTEPV
jgi:hypothetical protein